MTAVELHAVYVPCLNQWQRCLVCNTTLVLFLLSELLCKCLLTAIILHLLGYQRQTQYDAADIYRCPVDSICMAKWSCRDSMSTLSIHVWSCFTAASVHDDREAS